MDSDVREPGWWWAVEDMVMGWKDLKAMSPVELRHYCGGKS